MQIYDLIYFSRWQSNRRPDIFESCRDGRGPSEHANMIQKIILCDNSFVFKNRKYDEIVVRLFINFSKTSGH